jgi:hypothetical protein
MRYDMCADILYIFDPPDCMHVFQGAALREVDRLLKPGQAHPDNPLEM